MDTEELRDTLRDAGLSQYQAGAYCALLRLGSASATELADASTVPTARIYDVLRDLEDRGYIETYEQDSLRARASDPETVLSDLRGRASRLEAAADEIEERWEAPAVERHKMSIVKRFDTVRERAAATIREADSEVQVATSPAGFHAIRDALAAAVDRGVLVYVCICTDPESDEEVPSAAAFEGAATEVRHRTLPTPFVALVDRTHTYFAPHAGSLNQYGVLVEDFTMTYVFHWYFQTTLWEIWDVRYSARTNEVPIVYAGVRECVREIEPLLDAGAHVSATVRGMDRDTGDTVDAQGRVADVVYTGDPNGDGTPPLAQLAGQVCLILETDGGRLSVGGWGAVLEDVEATRITITGIDRPSTPPAADGSE
jgi:sugar-specific transcriptional regulator TrmB